MAERGVTVRLSVADGFSAQLRNFAAAIDNAEKKTKAFGATAGLMKNQYDSMANAGRMVAPVMIGIGVAGVAAGVGLFKMGANLEQVELAFTTMLKSGEKARGFLEDLKDFADKTPFEFPDMLNASRRLLAMGFSAESILPTMTAVGDAISGLGAGAAGVDRVTLALGQMNTLGKVQARDMMQLTEVGIPAWRYLAEAIGVTTGEVMKLSEQGLIPAKQGIDAILAGMEKDFGGLMAKQAETAAGKLSTLSDHAKRVAMDFGTLLLPAASKIIDAASEFVAGFEKMTDAEKALVVQVGLGGTALIGFAGIAVMTTVKVYELVTAIQAMAAAGALAKLGAAGLVAAPYVALATALAMVGKNALDVREGFAAIDTALIEQEERVRSTAGSYDEYMHSVLQALIQAHKLTVEEARAIEVTGDLRNANQALVDKYNLLWRATFNVHEATVFATGATEAWAQVLLESAHSTTTAGKAEWELWLQRSDELKQLEQMANAYKKLDEQLAHSTTATRELMLAEFKAQKATDDLTEARIALAENTDPAKERELTGAVLEAAVAYDAAAEAVRKLNEEQAILANAPLREQFEQGTRFSADYLQSIENLVDELARYTAANGRVIPPAENLAELQNTAAIAADEYREKTEALAKAQAKLAENTDVEKQRELERAVLDAQGAVYKSQGTMNDAAGAANNAAGGTANYSAKLQELHEKLQQVMDDQITASLLAQLQAISESGDRGAEAYNAVLAALKLVNPQAAAYYEQSTALAQVEDVLVGALERGAISANQFATAYGVLTAEIEKGTPITEAAAIAHQAVADAIAETRDNARESREKLERLGEGLASQHGPGSPWELANREVAEYVGWLSQIPADITTTVHFQGGGPGTPLKLQTGGEGIVPPGYPNDSYPILLSSGEKFRITTAGDNTSATPLPVSDSGGGNVTLTIHPGAIVVNGAGDAEDVAEAVMQAIATEARAMAAAAAGYSGV